MLGIFKSYKKIQIGLIVCFLRIKQAQIPKIIKTPTLISIVGQNQEINKLCI